MGYCSHWRRSYALTTVKLKNCQHWKSYRLPGKIRYVNKVCLNVKKYQRPKYMQLTSREMFGQYEALRAWRLAHVRAISRSVSSLTHEQFDRSKDSKSWHDIAAERIAASESLWQEAISRSFKRGQFSAACAMLLLFKDKVWSWGHLQTTIFLCRVD